MVKIRCDKDQAIGIKYLTQIHPDSFHIGPNSSGATFRIWVSIAIA